MITIIEGVDNVGKTTIINELMRRNPGIVIHSGKPNDRPPFHAPKFMSTKCDKNNKNNIMAYNQDIYFQNMLRLLYRSVYRFERVDTFSPLCDELNIYLDRFHLGEYVYSKYRPDTAEKNNYARDKIFEMVESNFQKFVYDFGEDKNDYVTNNIFARTTQLVLLAFSEDAWEYRYPDFDNTYNDNLESIQEDQKDFIHIFHKSELNKRIVYVTDKNGFRPVHEIVDEIEMNSVW